MKTKLFIWTIGILLVCLSPVAAQQTEWRSTSTLQGSGSAYAPQVTPVGSQYVPIVNSSGERPAMSPGARRNSDEWGENQEAGNKDINSPVGDAWVMLAFAAAACGIIFLRRRKVQKAENK